MHDLPIDELLPDIIASLRSHATVVVEAAPGAGKTTRLPLALLRAGCAASGEIVVLEPRRIAARLAAHFVSKSLGEEVGETCGYQVRFDSKVSARTRIRYMTEALLTRRMRDDPELRGISVVVLDEFHERHIAADLNLALLRRLQKRRKEPLGLIIMSATLDGEKFARELDCPRHSSEGRSYPIDIRWSPPPPARSNAGRAAAPALAQVPRVVREWVGNSNDEGNILVFLPGVGEIKKAARECANMAESEGLEILPLHGDLSVVEQHRALSPPGRRALILATNVAETSVTAEGVTCVIDTGLARRASFEAWSGLPVLELAEISRAATIQRAGRAGRTAPGTCIRLYSEANWRGRSEHEIPELLRLDLCDSLLDLYANGIGRYEDLAWLDVPPQAAITAARDTLSLLGAISEEDGGATHRLTDTGREMLRYPLHPRTARLLVEGRRRGIPTLAAGAAALLSEPSIRRRGERTFTPSDADVFADLEDMDRALKKGGRTARSGAGLSVGIGVDSGVHLGACRQVDRSRKQLIKITRQRVGQNPGSDSYPVPNATEDQEEALLRSLLCAYPDRVARVRGESGNERSLLVTGGTTATLSDESALGAAEFALALTLQEHRYGKGPGRVIVRSAARIEADWLIDEFSDDVEERETFTWNADRERVLGTSDLTYRGLTLVSTKMRGVSKEASAVLRKAALSAGAEKFVDDSAAIPALVARSALCAEYRPGIQALNEEVVREGLSNLCEGMTSFKELRDANLLAILEQQLGPNGTAELARLTPRSVTLAGRRRVQVHYESAKPPWIASRLQDFFGLQQSPTIMDGQLPLVLHLLAPNQRAVQITTDLPGFWERHYPALRRTLMRRYPKHAWPENP